MKITALLIASSLFLLPSAATAQETPEQIKSSQSVVNAVRIKGNQRVDTESVRSYLSFAEGEAFSEADLNNSIKALFKTGLYSDVKVFEKAGNIMVEVVENPIISQVAFEGNTTINDEKLIPEVTLKSRSIYTKAAVQEDVQRLANIYRRSGRFNAEIVPKVILKDQNRVDLVFEIDEAEVTRIKAVNFLGNFAYDDDDLRSVVRSAEEEWYNVLSSDDSYDPDRIEFDKELLRRHYAKTGYADFKVKSALAEQTLDEDGFILTFSVDEGTRYEIGEVNVFSALEDLSVDNNNKDLVKVRNEDVFDETRVEKTVELLIEEAGKKGYAFVDIDPELNKNEAEKKIDVDFIINEGPKVFVDRINIIGNQRTLDNVIRREFRLAEGDPYNSEKLKRSKQRIENLGFFESVDVKRQRGDAADKVDVDLTVKETSTGELNFGAGFSTTEGVLGDISVSERNLLGRGQFLRLNVSASARRQQGQISFTEPYFMDEAFAAGFDLFSTTRDEQDESSFQSESLGFNLRGGYEITEHLRHNVRYSFSNDEISDVSASASTFIKEQEGTTTTSLIGHSLFYDKRDNARLPRDGHVVRFVQDFAGLGGNVKFVRNGLETAYYHPLTDEKDWYMTFKAEGGNVTGFGGEDVPINHRYFIGGNSFRGFARSGIGPRDTATGDALGGNNYYTVSSEVAFPLKLTDDFGLTGAFFADVGSLWGVDSGGATIVDNADPRATIGFGLGWSSPFGPLRIDFGFPLVKDDVDETESFQLNFGTQF